MDSLAHQATIDALVELLYKMLPASGAPVTFEHVATRAGVSEVWAASDGQYKRPRIRHLIEATLTEQPKKLRNLIRGVVGASLSYRRAKKNPLRYEEIVQLKENVERLGFAMPDLLDPQLTRQLAGAPTAASVASATAATASTPTTIVEPQANLRTVPDIPRELDRLQADFLALGEMENRQRAGQLFNAFLSDIFAVFGLEPSEAFRVVGEEIDGAFYFEKEVYLLEAKWTADKTDAKELYAFNDKVRRKSAYTRGLFVAINGYTEVGIDAYRTGDAARVVLLDGAHLFRVLQGQVSLTSLLLRAVRHLSERGQPYLPVSEL